MAVRVSDVAHEGDALARCEAAVQQQAEQVDVVRPNHGLDAFDAQRAQVGEQLTQQRAPWLPPQVRAERVLDDLQFALWPTAASAAALPPGWQVADDGQQRTLSRDGTVWLLLQRRADGSVELDNRAEGYALRIESIDMAGQHE